MATIRENTVFIGITTPLSNYRYRKNERMEPQIRISYENTSNERVVETICADGARVLAKGLIDMADIADPPRKRS